MSNLTSLPGLPSLPSIKARRPCACGCAGLTQSRFMPGHDAKLYGWVRRAKAGVFAPDAPGDVIAQLDAALQWLTEANVAATAFAMGVEWVHPEDRKEEAVG